MKIDLHVHIKKLSRCAKMGIEDLVPKLLEHNISGVSPFDHKYFTSDEDISEIRHRSHKITVFKGTEINIRGPKGNIEDFVLISSQTPNFNIANFEIEELIKFQKESDALTILAHPYRRRDFVDFNFDWFLPDAVEIWSTHIIPENRDKIRELGRLYGMMPIVNSDAHKAKEIGEHYTEVPDGIQTCEELKWIIKTNRYHLKI